MTVTFYIFYLDLLFGLVLSDCLVGGHDSELSLVHGINDLLCPFASFQGFLVAHFIFFCS